MPTSVKVNDLKINRLTEAQYDAAVQAGVIGENELSIITDLEAGQIIQVDTLPTASADELDKIYQYIGTTDQDYTNGYFYKCVSDGQNPATYSWTQTNVQPTPVIPDPLPSQTGNAGKFLTTDGTDASWSDKPLVNTATANNSVTIYGTPATQGDSCINIGKNSSARLGGIALGFAAQAPGQLCVAISQSAYASGYYSIAIGNTANAIGTKVVQIGPGSNNEDNTFCFGNNNGNYKLVDSDGTIPEARLADTTSATQGQILTLDANGNAVWANPASPIVTPQTMPELTVNGWTTDPNTGDITQTVTVQGVTATNTVFVSPYPTSATDYANAGIICMAQSTNSLTFKCTTQPSNAITVNVLII